MSHHHHHDHENRHGDPHHHHEHHQDHEHHGHHGHHGHQHRSGHGSAEHSGAPSESDKMVKMVEHWIHHNEEHAKSYRTWADRARNMGLEQVGLVLDEVAGGTLAQNGSFDKILRLLEDESNK